MRLPRKLVRKPRYGERFNAVVKDAVERYERLYDIIRWVELWLERDPGKPPSEELAGGFWVLKSRAYPGSPVGPEIPYIAVIYRFGEDYYELWDMRVEGPSTAPPDADDAPF